MYVFISVAKKKVMALIHANNLKMELLLSNKIYLGYMYLTKMYNLILIHLPEIYPPSLARTYSSTVC